MPSSAMSLFGADLVLPLALHPASSMPAELVATLIGILRRSNCRLVGRQAWRRGCDQLRAIMDMDSHAEKAV